MRLDQLKTENRKRIEELLFHQNFFPAKEMYLSEIEGMNIPKIIKAEISNFFPTSLDDLNEGYQVGKKVYAIVRNTNSLKAGYVSSYLLGKDGIYIILEGGDMFRVSDVYSSPKRAFRAFKGEAVGFDYGTIVDFSKCDPFGPKLVDTSPSNLSSTLDLKDAQDFWHNKLDQAFNSKQDIPLGTEVFVINFYDESIPEICKGEVNGFLVEREGTQYYVDGVLNGVIKEHIFLSFEEAAEELVRIYRQNLTNE